MSKLKLGVIFGGMSTEHDVSVVSGKSILKNLDKNKYEVYPIYISKEGTWYLFDDKTKEYIIKWMCDRRDLLGDDLNNCNALFISNRKTRMSISSIEDVIEKYTKDTIKDKHITPHKLRSTCGTNIYQHTKDIYLVANVLGHKSTSPTKRYAKVFEEDKQNAINYVANLY